MRNFIITVAGVLVGLLLGELFIVPLANRKVDVEKEVYEDKEVYEEKEEIACFGCYTLVDGHCKDDTNWSKWCYNNFEGERPENDYYD